MGWIRKVRTTHGFGVHSPFAYSLINKVIRQTKAHYYAYPEIDSLCPKGRRTGLTDNFSGFHYAIPDARLLFRLLCWFNPSQVIESGNGHEVTNTILERSVPHAERYRFHPDREVEITRDGTVFVLVNIIDDHAAAALVKLIGELAARKDGVVAVVRNIAVHKPTQRFWKQLLDNTGAGMDFSNGHLGILCRLQGLPRQSYSLYF